METIVTSMRRTRVIIRSWHDVALIVFLIALYVVLNMVIKKLAPNMKEKAIDIICGVIIVIVGIIGFFLLTPLTQK